MKRLYWIVSLILILPLVIIAQENRSFDGSGNNETNTDWGAAESLLEYHIGNAFADGISTPSGADRPNSREISNAVFDQAGFIQSNLEISDFGWGFGQFIDHDITFVADNGDEPLMIAVPSCDVHFDPSCTGSVVIPMKRSNSSITTGTDNSNPRKVINSITGFADGSGVYGSNESRANWLRTFTGGKLKSSTGNNLPFNTITGNREDEVDLTAPFMIIEGTPRPKHLIAGDVRANEQPGLASFHTLFMREHNRLCEELIIENPSWNDEQLYQRARKIVGALIQVVLYEEFLPALGVEIPEYKGYDANVNPSIMNVFSAAAYRLGHTLVNDQIIRMNDAGEPLSFGSLHIKDAFFNPFIILDEDGIDPIFIGMATQMQQTFDTKVVTTLRNFLFGAPGMGGLDLVSINIQRGRERGLPDYNSIRTLMGLDAYTTFSQITDNTALQTALENTYSDINKIDPWVGMLSESMMNEKALGELIHTILQDQFMKLRDGDRYYYENDAAFTQDEVDELQATKLSAIIKRNTEIQHIQDDVFHAQEHTITAVDLTPFDGIRTISIDAYPNPVNQFLNVAFKSSDLQMFTMTLTDVNGQVFMQEHLSVNKGENKYQFELDENYTSGVYIINISNDIGAGNLKLVKQ